MLVCPRGLALVAQISPKMSCFCLFLDLPNFLKYYVLLWEILRIFIEHVDNISSIFLNTFASHAPLRQRWLILLDLGETSNSAQAIQAIRKTQYTGCSSVSRNTQGVIHAAHYKLGGRKMYVEVIARSGPQGQARQSARQLAQIYIIQDLQVHRFEISFTPIFC